MYVLNKNNLPSTFLYLSDIRFFMLNELRKFHGLINSQKVTLKSYFLDFDNFLELNLLNTMKHISVQQRKLLCKLFLLYITAILLH